MNRSQSPWINFFNRPILWGWAAGTVVAVIVGTIILSAPTITNLSTGEVILMPTEEFDFIILYLAPFGVKLIVTVAGIFGPETIIGHIQSSLTLGVIIMVLCFLGSILFTKRSQSGLYVVGPFWVYGTIIILFCAIVATNVGDTNNNAIFVWLPTLFNLMFWSAISGLLAKILAILSLKLGWIEGLDDVNHNQPIKFNPPPILATVGTMVTESVKSVPSTTTEGITKIGRSANYCPYCGNNRLKKQGNICVCPVCNSINFGASPIAGNTKCKCLQCEAGILQNAQFCWDCGKLLANQQDSQQSEQPIEVDAEKHRYCSYCGVKVSSDAKFCDHCGKALAD